MSKNLFLAILACATAFAACSRQSDSFVLHGTVTGGGNDSILVTGMDSRFDRVDTIRMENGRFTYSCDVDTIVPLIFLFSDGREDVVFAEKHLTASFLKDSTDIPARIDGGESNLKLAQFQSHLSDNATPSEIINLIDSFIVKNPFSEVSPYLIYRYFFREQIISEQRTIALTDKMSGLIQDNTFILGLRQELNKKARNVVQLDNKNLTDTAFVSSPLEELFDSGYQLICFWASWDEASHKALKEMSELKDKYKEKELTLAGISIDTNKELWKKTVIEDSLDYKQYIDAGGWQGPIASQFELRELPYYTLLGPQRRIVDKGNTLEPIERRISLLNDKDKTKRKPAKAPAKKKNN